MKVSGKILLLILVSSGFCAARCEATVYHSNGSAANVQALLNLARDGDIITLPAGTFSWTSPLEITKGITLQGATTITGPVNNPTVRDATIILDNTPRSGANAGIITAAIRSSQSFRLTGITFKPGSSTQMSNANGAVHLVSNDAAPCMSMRIDHCHFASLYQGKLIWISGWVYGVADHNVIECRGNSFPFTVWHNSWGGISQVNGNGSWADYPWYGTEKFFFIEDNTVIRRNQVNTLVDAYFGGRWVARHNYLQNAIPSGHGTEGGPSRGQRVNEFYDNTVNITVPWSGGGQRSGTSLWHDNSFIGRDSTNARACNLSNVRETPHRPYPVWGIADGTSPWDVNDTEGNGTYVEGHRPYLFDSGTDTSSVNSQGVIHDSTKSWTPNQWVGYSIKNTNPHSHSYTLGSYIISNTSKTITYYYYAPADGGHLIFNAGDTYQIHRVLTMMDQNGRGKGDQVTGNPQPINTRTGTPWWTHEALEPCYSWNNIYTPTGGALGFGSGSPTTVANRDYYNLGRVFPWDSTPAQVSATYTAALNGLDYVRPYIYPHPLTLLPIGDARAAVADFNADGHPDYVLQNPSTHQTEMWYLNDNVHSGSDHGPTLPGPWRLAGVADFNRDSHPDYALFSSFRDLTAIAYLSGPTAIGAALGPALYGDWEPVAAADFNRDGKQDYLLYNTHTRQTAICYLDNNTYIGVAWGPSLPPGWTLVGAADFNGDGKPDYLLYNSNTQQTLIAYLNNNVCIGAAWGPTLPLGWRAVATADFNGDSKPDCVLYNVTTQETSIVYLDNNVYLGIASGPTLPPGWGFFGP